MRKLFISFALLISTISIVSAQVLGIHPRFEAGVSLPKVESSLENIDLHSNSNTGYRVGVAVELPVFPFVYIAPGVALRNNQISSNGSRNTLSDITKLLDQALGTKISDGSVGLGPNGTLTYLLVPVNIGTKFSLLGLGVSAEAGPYASYAINTPFSTFGDNISLNKFTYGLGGSVAAHLGKTTFRLGYEYELSKKFSSEDKTTPQYKDNAFFFTVGYRL